MSDEFLECLGEIAVGSAWLEDLLASFIHTLCGTKKAVVFTQRMTFSGKCDKLAELLKFSTDPVYVTDVQTWLKECRAVAKARNSAIHTRHRSLDGRAWRRVEQDAETEISIGELAAIPIRIAELYDRGLAYERGRTELHRQIEDEDARANALLESLSDEGGE